MVRPGRPACYGELNHNRVGLGRQTMPVDHHQERGVVEEVGEGQDG